MIGSFLRAEGLRSRAAYSVTDWPRPPKERREQTEGLSPGLGTPAKVGGRGQGWRQTDERLEPTATHQAREVTGKTRVREKAEERLRIARRYRPLRWKKSRHIHSEVQEWAAVLVNVSKRGVPSVPVVVGLVCVQRIGRTQER